MLEQFRKHWAAAMKPGATVLMRLGVKPDHVTWTGTALVVLVSLVCVPQGWLWQGALLQGVLVLTDGLDGQLARMTDRVTTYGAFLDSSLDRVADGVIFGAVVLWLAARDTSTGWWATVWAGVAIWALVMGQVTSYVKARAESVGYECHGGIAARADRLLILLLGMLLQGLGVPFALHVAVALLALASTYTVMQRMGMVKRQAAEALTSR